jgi:hypothetical protein
MDEWHSSVNAARLQENPLGVHQGGIVVIHIKALAQDMLIDDVILSDDVKGFVAESPEDVKTVVEIYDELHDDDCLSLTARSGRIESCRWDYYMTVVDLTSGNLVDIHTFRGGTIPTEVRVGRVNGHFTTFGGSTHTHIINLDNPVIQAYISGEPPSSSEVYTYLFEMWAEGDK